MLRSASFVHLLASVGLAFGAFGCMEDPVEASGSGAAESTASASDTDGGTGETGGESADSGTNDGSSSGDEADATSTAGDGDGDPTSGDGDGDPGTTSGDGDGDPGTTSGGDGDGDPGTTSGDGDGDPGTTSGGDGDPTSGGDGDPTSGGDGDPGTTSGGDGDPTSGGDGDPTSGGDGDGDPTSGGDGDGGDGDGGDGDDNGDIIWDFEAIYGVTNRDDDDQGGLIDFQNTPFAGDDDFSTLLFEAATLAQLPAGASVELTLAGDTFDIRVWSGQDIVLGANASSNVWSFQPSGSDLLLDIEFGEYFARGTLTIRALDASDVELASATIPVEASPLILNHHLLPAEALWVVGVNNNGAMINDYENAFGASFTEAPGNAYFGDVWIQDEIEFATQRGNQGQRQDVIIDSIRDRGLDDFPEDIQGGLYAVDTWGQPNFANSCDSFGNLEISPPVTVNGVEYPFGRIYWGNGGNGCQMSSTLRNFLIAQEVQAPVEVDTSWLCVGHADEFATFIPDPDSPKGFKLLFADTNEAWALLESMPGNTNLPRYGNTHGYNSVNAILNDNQLRFRNDDIQVDILDPILDSMKANFGLDDSDVILIPSLFEECGGNSYNVALIPGMPNLIVGNEAGQPIKLMVPDPFVRSNSGDQGADPFIADFIARMPAAYGTNDIIFTDDWYTYHANLGEVHCGTNVRRTPSPLNWWEVASHLTN